VPILDNFYVSEEECYVLLQSSSTDDFG